MRIQAIVMLTLLTLTHVAAQETTVKSTDMEALELTREWDKTFPQSDRVEHSKVTFHNRYGITLAADLYKPKNGREPLAAVAVSGPYGAVKEQVSGRYAQTLAEQGFLTVAFDPSYYGESGGTPRYLTSPEISTEDFSAAVDYLSTREDVDPERIGIPGICGWGGFALNAAANDPRVKATVTSTMYDTSRVNADGYFDAMSADDRYELRERLNAQRTEDYRNSSYKLSGGVVDPVPEDAPLFRASVSRLLQDCERLSPPLSELQRRNHRNQCPVVHQHAYSFLYWGDPQPRAAGSRREGSLPIFQRGCVQEADRRQQGTADCPRSQPCRSVRQSGCDTVRQDRRIFPEIFNG